MIFKDIALLLWKSSAVVFMVLNIRFMSMFHFPIILHTAQLTCALTLLCMRIIEGTENMLGTKWELPGTSGFEPLP